MAHITLQDCQNAILSLRLVDNDDAGMNEIAYIGQEDGKHVWLTRCVRYAPEPSLEGMWFTAVADSMKADTELFEGQMSQEEIGTEISPEVLFTAVRGL